MNVTLPSQNKTFAPVGWVLEAFSYCPNSMPQPAQSSRQPAHWYWAELGGMMVLKSVTPGDPAAQR